jgi:putative PEP-CTERM system TPR-repeat lipoprotein
MRISGLQAAGCIVALLTIVVSGCGYHDAATFVSSAKKYVAKNDYPSAIIELKNALQKDPDSGEARLLLAGALLELGDAVGAEVEVRKAIALHAPEEKAYPVLARALAVRGEYKKLASELGERKFDDPHARAELAVAFAMGALAQGDSIRGKELADAALKEEPTNISALILQAEIAAKNDDGKAARQFIDAGLQAAPTNLALLLMKSNLEVAEGRLDAARSVLDTALAAHPDSTAARYSLFELAIRTQKLDVAKEQVATLRKKAPKDLRTNYADALLSYAQNDRAHAKEAIQYVVSAAPEYTPALLLSATIDTQAGNFGSAEVALRKVLAKNPDNFNVRRMLAVLYLGTNRPAQALEVLGPALESRDPALLRVAGEAYLASGNATRAAEVYERANALDRSNIPSQVRLAQVRLAGGDTARGISALESIASSSEKETSAELALYTEFMRKRQYDKALAEVDAFERKRPASPMVASLRGAAYMAKRDLVRARASFEKALQVPATAEMAAHNLTVIDLQEGKSQAARERYQSMIAKDPKSETLQFELAQVLSVSGAPASEVKAALDKAIVANPASVRARVALVAFEGRTAGPKAAVVAAQAAVAAIPDNPQLVETLGASLLVAGEPNRSIETFRKLVELQPENPLALLRLSEAQVAVKDYAGAITSQRKALALKPDDPRVLAALTKTYVASGQADAALAEAKRLQKEHPQLAAGYALQGDILAASKKWDEAAAAYKAAIDRQPLGGLVVLQYASLQSGGKSAEARALAKKWTAEHPDDTAIPLMLAGESLRRNDMAAARQGYEHVLSVDADNFVALNNLASLLAQQGDAKAVEYAERAHAIAPFNPAVLDTLGWTLAQMREPKRGVEFLRMATRLAPRQAEIRLHLVKAMIAAGDKAGARQEAAALLTLDKSSPIRLEAEKLQATL